MTDPTPYTAEEEAPVREQIGKGWNQGISVERRLLATVDAERARANQAMWTCPDCAFSFAAEHTDPDGSYTCPCCAEAALIAERDAARADRVYWRETHNQVAAERDAARADRVYWRETHNQVAAERDALVARLYQWASEWLCRLPTTGPMRSEFRRALDASPTEGNPDE